MTSASPAPAAPPPGWYPDPAGSEQERYWEGTRWTKNLRDAQEDPTVELKASEPVAVRPDPHTQVRPGTTPPPPRPPGTGGAGHFQAPIHPYPMAVGKPRVTADGVPLAAYWKRVVATLIDWVLTSLLGVLVGWSYARRAWNGFKEFFAWSMDNPGVWNDGSQFDYAVPASNLMMVVALVAFATQLPLVAKLGGTIGQVVMGLRVVPAGHGRTQRVSWATSLRRSAAWLAIHLTSMFLFFLPQLVSYLRPLWHPGRQTWHDSLAHTQVIDARLTPSR